MCVEIIKSEDQQSYKPELPLEDQICGCQEVLIDCANPKCYKVAKFLDEIEKVCKNGQSLPINIRLADNTNLKLFSKTKKLSRELLLNDIMGHMALIHKNADDKLKELSEMCLKGSCGG
jgi:hypothetical protein